MKKKFLAVVAVCLAFMLCFTGCSGVADLLSSDDSDSDTETSSSDDTSDDTEETEEEILANLYDMDTRRSELLEDIENLVTLGEYKNIEVTIEATVVTDDDVQAEIDSTLESYGTVEEITEGTIADGDTLNIDYVGTIDGEEFDGGTAESQSLTIGSGAYIDGFEDALIGQEIGTTFDINVTFPDNYGDEDLNGKDAVFTITVNYKEGDTIPAELTDDFVADLGIDDVSTVDEYEEYVRSLLEEDAADEDETKVYTALMEIILENATINGYSSDLDADEMYDEEIEYIESYAEYYSMEVEDLIQEYYGESYEEYQVDLKEDIQTYINRLMIYRAVINAEDLQIEQEDYEEAVLSYSPYYASYSCESESEFAATYSAEIYDGLINSAAEEFLIDNAVVVTE